MPKRVLNVGQCVPDGMAIKSFLKSRFGAAVQSADTADEAMAMAANGPFDLVLVNRVFDADGGSGLDLVKALKTSPTINKLPVMLVSNYPDAQDKAVALGAEPGFGKAELGSPHVVERLSAFLSGDETE